MSKNKGKGFEEHIQQAFESVPNCIAHRLKDQIGKYRNVSNPCDFYFYRMPYFYAIETKSTHGASLPFSNIREKEQIDDLHELSMNDGVVAGFIIWFIDKDETVFVSHDIVYSMYKEGLKSISLRYIKELPQNKWCVIEGTKKRVYFNYTVDSFLVWADETRRC